MFGKAENMSKRNTLVIWSIISRVCGLWMALMSGARSSWNNNEMVGVPAAYLAGKSNKKLQSASYGMLRVVEHRPPPFLYFVLSFLVSPLHSAPIIMMAEGVTAEREVDRASTHKTSWFFLPCYAIEIMNEVRERELERQVVRAQTPERRLARRPTPPVFTINLLLPVATYIVYDK